MAITYFGTSVAPTDNTAQAGPGPLTIIPPGSMVASQLVVVIGQYRGVTAPVYSVTVTGGQTWSQPKPFTTLSGVQGTYTWCIFNGTWAANPQFQIGTGVLALSFDMFVFSSSGSTYTWAVDTELASATFGAPGSPFTVTRTGTTPNYNSNVTIAAWMVGAANTWGTLAGAGWSVLGAAQHRNTTGSAQSSSYAYQVETTAVATGNVSKNESAGTAGVTGIVSFFEYVKMADLGGEKGFTMESNPVAPSTVIGGLKGFYMETDLNIPVKIVDYRGRGVSGVKITVTAPANTFFADSNGNAIIAATNPTTLRVDKEHIFKTGISYSGQPSITIILESTRPKM